MRRAESYREEKINVELMTGSCNDSYNKEEEEANSVFYELNVLQSSSPSERSVL